MKETSLSRLREDTSLQFRAEFFNALNRVNLANPATNLFEANGNRRSNAGQVIGTRGTARQIQFGLRIIF
jgi:hypothetical protein